MAGAKLEAKTGEEAEAAPRQEWRAAWWSENCRDGET